MLRKEDEVCSSQIPCHLSQADPEACPQGWIAAMLCSAPPRGWHETGGKATNLLRHWKAGRASKPLEGMHPIFFKETVGCTLDNP